MMFEDLCPIYGKLSRVGDEIRGLRERLRESHDPHVREQLKEARARQEAILRKVIDGD
jgi:hypothetical protein